MISVGICDDDQNMRKALRGTLERNMQLLGVEYIIHEYCSGEALLNAVNTDSLSLLFLDIEMKGINGIETAKLMRKQEQNTVLVFVTAFPDFVFQGYDVHAFQYILKPYKESKIAEVLSQALNEYFSHQELYYSLEQQSGIRKIPMKHIISFCSDRRKIIIHTQEENLEFYGKLTDILKDLPDNFTRIHNRYLINLNYVTSIGKNECTCGNEIYPVSRTYKQDFEIKFAQSLLH